MNRTLRIDPAMGMAGDMFAAALIGLGAPEVALLAAMQAAGETLGDVTVQAERIVLPDGVLARRLYVIEQVHPPLRIADARRYLDQALVRVNVQGAYADFARRALDVLCRAEAVVHNALSAPNPDHVSLTIIGHAHTPYQDRAPYQPRLEQDAVEDAFYVELDPAYATGMSGLETFTHIFVLAYLDRSHRDTLHVHPPWRQDDAQYGLFATRSPNRPNPIGLTRTRLRRIEENRIYTGPLDLFDGTPILDLKPFIRSLDGLDEAGTPSERVGNDGWLEGSDHLALHRRGVPHEHPGGGVLHEAQDILLDVTGAAWGLQALQIDLDSIQCFSPVRVGGGDTGPTSHGRLPVPAPATQAILEQHHIPYQPGPVDVELLTPTGAAILAALSPAFIDQKQAAVPPSRIGVGLGHRVFAHARNALQLILNEKGSP